MFRSIYLQGLTNKLGMTQLDLFVQQNDQDSFKTGHRIPGSKDAVLRFTAAKQVSLK